MANKTFWVNHGEASKEYADSHYSIKDNGVLVVSDKPNNRRITYSPTGWTSISEDLPEGGSGKVTVF